MTSTLRSRRLRKFLARSILVIAVVLLVAVAAYALNVAAGMHVAAQVSGTLRIPGLRAPVTIVRDDRYIPHIQAANDRDLFFAQGFAEGSDRLFQMDLVRRFVYGKLAEVFGSRALSADENARIVDIRGIVARQWQVMAPRDRETLQAFSDGVNAAMARQPVPVEFRMLLYKPQPWSPQDTLAAGMATVLDLIDSWDDVIRRDGVAKYGGPKIPMTDLYTITDPAYDAPIAPAKPQPVPSLPSMPPLRSFISGRSLEHPPVGSNEVAIGADRSQTGRALLANDPHLRLSIPGVWYLVDLQSPRLHVAGAVLAGTPGVILGHNADIAWGATNATVVTDVVYRGSLKHTRKRREVFRVRLSGDVTATYYETTHGFVTGAYAVDWNAATRPASPLPALSALDRARNVRDALAALRSFPGPPQNFVVADRSGNAAYHIAGLVPDDPAWGLRVHAATDPHYGYIAFDRLPQTAASRSPLLFSANNRTYGAGYPYRLTANFAPPYRAARLRGLLRARKRLSVADLRAIQLDTLSLPERDLARDTVAALRRNGDSNDRAVAPYVSALSRWDGRFDPDSRGAAIAWALRGIAVAELANTLVPARAGDYEASSDGADLMLLMRALRERKAYDAVLISSFYQAIQNHGTRLLEPWGRFGEVTPRHALAALGFTFLNGPVFAGDGDRYSVHVQSPTFSQSFRAVWDVGNWNAGGIAIPNGESGEPGSGHYVDLAPAWKRGELAPLPFGEAAVRAAARATLTLLP